MAVTPNSIVYPQNVRTVQAVATAAKTTYNDTTGAVLLAAVGANGGLLKKLKARPRATVTDTQILLFVTKAADTSNTAPFLIDSNLLKSYTFSATTAVPATDFGYTAADPRRLEAGDKLYVAIGVALASGVVFEAELEEF